MDLLLLGLTLGMANALLAVGLVMVHLSTRVINFAHGELGAFAVAMMLMLVRAYHWPYWPSLVCSLLATALLAAVIERSPQSVVEAFRGGLGELEPYVDPKKVKTTLDGHRSGDPGCSEVLWQAQALRVWLRNFRSREYDPPRRVVRAAALSRLPVAG